MMIDAPSYDYENEKEEDNDSMTLTEENKGEILDYVNSLM